MIVAFYFYLHSTNLDSHLIYLSLQYFDFNSVNKMVNKNYFEIDKRQLNIDQIT
ncbi:MAG: hypothetical protein TRG1_2115 [Flavobacteriaceae bacterium FS1-H7996/R]|nr:MAG: hypothetical protein TRG1_2115 [Flavobacteriaceae bacterium FS1-H7996/R]